MSVDEIQGLLDDLAARLRYSLALEDPGQRLLAYTEHPGAIDDVRLASILGRRATGAVRAWFEQWGIREATEPVRTPASAGLGAIARWCVPVRFRGALLGYVWVLDGGELPASELGSAIDVAGELAALLHRRRLADRADAELVRLLVLHGDADDDLGDAYPHRGAVAVVVAGRADDEELDRAALGEVRGAVRRACEPFPPGAAVGGEVGGLVTAIVPLRRVDDLAPARRLAEGVLRLLAPLAGDAPVAVGIGGAAASVASAPRAYLEARRALRVGRAVAAFSPIAAWDELGVFRTLAMVPPAQLDESVVDPRVRALLAQPALAATAEAFLDTAGDAQATAERLVIHRATLYQRLGRIRETTGLDLARSGDDRLITHLGLRLDQLARRRPR